MTKFSLGQAAKLVGVGQTTLTRNIKSGRLSAERRFDGSYLIEASELARVYELTPETLATGRKTDPVVHTATPAEADQPPVDTVAVRLARLEGELAGLKAVLEEVKSGREELRADRDQWRAQAERLALVRPGAGDSSPDSPGRASWWRRFAG